MTEQIRIEMDKLEDKKLGDYTGVTPLIYLNRITIKKESEYSVIFNIEINYLGETTKNDLEVEIDKEWLLNDYSLEYCSDCLANDDHVYHDFFYKIGLGMDYFDYFFIKDTFPFNEDHDYKSFDDFIKRNSYIHDGNYDEEASQYYDEAYNDFEEHLMFILPELHENYNKA
nr:hypothetical protein [Moritella viscosa]SHO15147.1 Putative uncharacterized protein [Moritella viscosa]